MAKASKSKQGTRKRDSLHSFTVISLSDDKAHKLPTGQSRGFVRFLKYGAAFPDPTTDNRFRLQQQVTKNY